MEGGDGMRKIDAMVAENVMGAPVKWGVIFGDDWYQEYPSRKEAEADMNEGETELEHDGPKFSTDPAAMMVVVEKMCEAHWPYMKKPAPGDGDRERWRVTFHNKNGETGVNARHGVSDSLPLAVCLAALRAVGVPESEIEAARGKP